MKKLGHRKTEELNVVHSPFAYCKRVVGVGDRRINVICFEETTMNCNRKSKEPRFVEEVPLIYCVCGVDAERVCQRS